MGLELRKVADTIMSDLGMGEDQGKIDALEQYLEENLSLFFSEDSYMSSVIKMGAEKSFTSHSAKIKDFLTGSGIWKPKNRSVCRPNPRKNPAPFLHRECQRNSLQ
eukprot:COSAG05_NODE_459_length_9617_cov_12.484661_1_plen_106_part_10